MLSSSNNMMSSSRTLFISPPEHQITLLLPVSVPPPPAPAGCPPSAGRLAGCPPSASRLAGCPPSAGRLAGCPPSQQIVHRRPTALLDFPPTLALQATVWKLKALSELEKVDQAQNLRFGISSDVNSYIKKIYIIFFLMFATSRQPNFIYI